MVSVPFANRNSILRGVRIYFLFSHLISLGYIFFSANTSDVDIGVNAEHEFYTNSTDPEFDVREYLHIHLSHFSHLSL